MSIPAFDTLYRAAKMRLDRAPQQKKIVLIYASLACAAAALITCLQYYLGVQISHTGGLSNLGQRSLLSSLSQFLPILQTVFLMMLQFGYMAAMVRISRGQYTSPMTLKAGMDRFWPLIRCSLIKMVIYMSMVFISIYVAAGIYFISPFADKLLALLTPYITDSNVVRVEDLVIDEAAQAAIFRATIPALFIFAIVCLTMCIPVFYRYRMVNYLLYDRPDAKALMVLRDSKLMMRHNRIKLFKLDLHFWWYYLLMLLVTLIAYTDMLLPMVGIQLPISEDVGYFLFYFLSLVIQFVIFYFLRNRIETVYALAYDALRPKPQDNGGVVLGNIFQM